MRRFAGIPILILAVAVPGTLLAQSAVEKQVADTIAASFEYSKKNKKDKSGAYSKDGSLEFWSSGGLLQEVPAKSKPDSYESFSLNPKHIRVVELSADVAVAFYYSEGAYKTTEGAEVPHYMTRALEVYVKEGREWKVRAAHWSPIVGGSGTSQTAPPVD